METPSQDEVLVPLSRVSRFIRQFTHDVRNGLSAIDLEAAFIAELVTDPEAAEEVRKLRNMVSSTAKTLKELSSHFQPVTLHEMPWKASTFVEELEGRVRGQFPQEEAWAIENRLGEECVNIDLEQMANATIHVLRNAFQFRDPGMPVRLLTFFDEGRVILELRESKGEWTPELPPEQWSSGPLLSTRQGGYGLGLYRAKKILESHGGRLESFYRDHELITRMVLPLCTERVE